MHFFHCVTFSLGCFSLLWRTIICAPTQPIHSSQLDTGCSTLFTGLASPFNDSNPGGPGLSTTRNTHHVSIDRGTWKISDTMSLALSICNWEPDPATIQTVLIAASAAVGKKPAAGLLDRTFTQKSNNRYNTLLFEISPRYTNYQLTWGDVGEVLGEHGLLEFYETTLKWNTIYFTLIHATRGELGRGAVRRWWQLEAPNGRNETASGNGGDSVELS